MLFHYISTSNVHLGDHLYRWQNGKLVQGIAVRRDDDTSEILVVTTNGLKGFHLMSLSQFKEKRTLRRVCYDQGDSYLHWMKLSRTSFIEKRRPVEEIIQNALLLLDVDNRNPECIQEFLVNNFAKTMLYH